MTVCVSPADRAHVTSGWYEQHELFRRALLARTDLQHVMSSNIARVTVHAQRSQCIVVMIIIGKGKPIFLLSLSIWRHICICINTYMHA